MRFRRVRARAVILVAIVGSLAEQPAISQSAPGRVPQVYSPPTNTWTRRVINPYRRPGVAPVNFQNSNRIFDLIRAGQLYLSLYDAIALALENNLDLQLERYLPLMADADILRARGGGILRGLSLLINEIAPGIGGPNGPLLTTLTAGSLPSPLVNTNFSDIALISQQQNDLSLLGQIPLSIGQVIPQYDPIVTGLLEAAHQSTAQFSTVLTGGSNWLITDSRTANLGFIKGFSPGTQISATFDNTRFTSNALFYTYNPLLNSSLNVTLTQPLLRGFGIGMNRRFIRIAKNSEKIADLVFQQQAIDTVAGIARLYTDLVSLREDVKVKEEALVLAERLYQDNKNKVEQGTLAPIELTRAEAQVAANRQALITSQGLVKQQELIVKTAITRGGLADPAIRDAHLIPTDPVTVPANDTMEPVQNLFAEALRNRPDLNQAGIQVENSRISLQGALNAVRPELDIVGMVQNGGLSGDLNPRALTSPVTAGTNPTVTPGGYPTVLGQIFRNNFPSYSIGIQLMLPLRNRVAQADAVRDELQLRQTEVRRKQLEDQIRLEVADALVTMQQARAAYEAAVQTRVLQEQSVTVEEQKLAVGISTNYLVIQFQTYLAQARSTELAAKGAYVKARIALERALGRTLEANHVSVFEAYRGQASRPPAPIPGR